MQPRRPVVLADLLVLRRTFSRPRLTFLRKSTRVDLVSYCHLETYLVSVLTSFIVIPDLLDSHNVNILHLWEGSWSYLTHLKWIKVNSEGQVRSTAFPSGGTN